MEQQTQLRITEIFHSLQGETRTMGWPTVFVRLTGCPLRCSYCDSAYAFHGGKMLPLAHVVEQVRQYPVKYVTITGGEPLAQPACIELLKILCDQGYEVSLETSGALSVANVDPRVIKVIDLKTPGSGELARNDFKNIEWLLPHDQIKFVICDQNDYEWSKKIVEQFRLNERCEVLFSPSYLQMNNIVLAEWILADRLPVRFQLQMHKYIWGDVPGK